MPSYQKKSVDGRCRRSKWTWIQKNREHWPYSRILRNKKMYLIDLDAHLCSPGPISSASHKTTHNQETNTHRQSVLWTQSQEEELIVEKLLSEYPILYPPLGLWTRPRCPKKSGLLTYGPIWSHNWWEMVPDTHLQKSHGPIGGEKYSQQLSSCRYRSTDLRPGRSITVDMDGR